MDGVSENTLSCSAVPTTQPPYDIATCFSQLTSLAASLAGQPSSEMQFLYGNNVPKSGLGRMTDEVPQYGGVVVLSMNDVPLGFGVAAQSTAQCKELEPTGNVVLHQGDIGEVRIEARTR